MLHADVQAVTRSCFFAPLKEVDLRLRETKEIQTLETSLLASYAKRSSRQGPTFNDVLLTGPKIIHRTFGPVSAAVPGPEQLPDGRLKSLVQPPISNMPPRTHQL